MQNFPRLTNIDPKTENVRDYLMMCLRVDTERLAAMVDDEDGKALMLNYRNPKTGKSMVQELDTLLARIMYVRTLVTKAASPKVTPEPFPYPVKVF